MAFYDRSGHFYLQPYDGMSALDAFRNQSSFVLNPDLSAWPDNYTHGNAFAFARQLDDLAADLRDQSSTDVSDIVSSARDIVSGAAAKIKDGITPQYTGGGIVAPVSDYVNADIAKAYGMDNATAYQEALANTSYQRAVNDLRSAGLNPALIAGNFSGASGVGYVSDGVSSGVSSAQGAHDFWQSLSNIGGVIGGVIGYKQGGLKGATYGSRAGSQILGAVGNLVDSVNRK